MCVCCFQETEEELCPRVLIVQDDSYYSVVFLPMVDDWPRPPRCEPESDWSVVYADRRHSEFVGVSMN